MFAGFLKLFKNMARLISKSRKEKRNGCADDTGKSGSTDNGVL